MINTQNFFVLFVQKIREMFTNIKTYIQNKHLIPNSYKIEIQIIESKFSYLLYSQRDETGQNHPVVIRSQYFTCLTTK